MKQKRAVLLSWGLCALVVVSTSAQTIFRLARSTTPPSANDLIEIFGWGLVLPVTFAVVAALIVARQPGNRVGWLMMLPALTSASPVEVVLDSLSAPPAAFTPGLWLLAWLSGWGWIPLIFPVLLIPLHFPDGRPPSRRWAWVNRLAVVMWLIFIVFSALVDTLGSLNGGWTLPNPIGFIALSVMAGSSFMIPWGIGLATLTLSSAASLFARYRRAPADARQQIKWLLFAGAAFAVFYSVSVGVLLRVSNPSGVLFNLLFVIALLGFPVAIALAILRHRLYDIDLIIRRTLVYSLLTGLLALVYLGSVVLLQTLFGRAAGAQSPLVIVLSTLLIAALSSPLRRRVQEVIDHRFYRRKYDAQQVLAAFAIRARDEVELDELTAELMRVVEETIRPERMSLWLKRP